MTDLTTQPPEIIQDQIEKSALPFSRTSVSRNLRLAMFLLGLICGLVQSWSMRHEILSDGISYLEIATQYSHGDWWNALNAYWSPLFSLILAVFLFVLHPAPYWQVATMHLAILFEYLVCLVAFDFLLRELLSYKAENELSPSAPNLRDTSIYLSAYSALLFVSWSYINFWYCSPDMLGMGLLFLLSAVIMKIRRTGGTTAQFASLGILGGLSFLNRTAFLPSFVICLVVVAILLWKKPVMLRAWLVIVGTFLVVALPFTAALSIKEKRLTIGDSGRLNYSWELDGAHRWIHWQGEPGNLGVPIHPTHLAIASPKTFTFATPVNSTYPPWYAPAYWYAGIQPRIIFSNQLRALVVNASQFVRLMFRSPILIPLLFFALLSFDRRCFNTLIGLWPVLLPSVATVALYALVYMEKRYVAGNILIFWIAPLVCLRLNSARILRAAQVVIPGIALLMTLGYAATRFRGAVADGVSDLIHRQERLKNVNYVIADNLRRAGLCPGDRVAFVGPGMNADWARLAGVKIVAEVPLMYSRVQTLLNNLHIDNPSEIKSFFNSDPATRQHVYDVFRSVGAKMVVTDGFYSYKLSDSWSRIIEANSPHIPKFYPADWSLVNSRYLWLDSNHGSCGTH